MKHKSDERLKEHHVEIFLINIKDPVNTQLLRDSFNEAHIGYIEKHFGVSDFIIGTVASRNYGIDFYIYDADYEKAVKILDNMEFSLDAL